MKFGLIVLVFIFMILGTHGKKQKEGNMKEEEDGLSNWRSSLNELWAVLQQNIMPTLYERTEKLTDIIESNKKPIHDNLVTIKEKMGEHMMSAGFDILENSLDMADLLQNMTNRIKSDVLNLTPAKAGKSGK